MSDEARRSEQERRELAQQHAGEIVEGSARVVTPRRLGQMVSLRLEPGLAEALRKLAERRGISLSLDPPNRTYEMTRLRWSEALSCPFGPAPIW